MIGAGALTGKTVVCVASGPSLTAEDCALVEASGNVILAVNNSWQRVHCIALYASDYDWWRLYAHTLPLPVERWSNNARAIKEYGCHGLTLPGGRNSGLAAIHLAAWWGAARIVLLGYDAQPQGGRIHWHPPHTRCRNPNDRSYRIWRKQFAQLDELIAKRVVNCSRSTALRCYLQIPLEIALK